MLSLSGYCEMGSRQSKSPQIPPKPNAYLRFDDFEVFRAIGRGAFGKVSAPKSCYSVSRYSEFLDIVNKSQLPPFFTKYINLI